MKKLVIAALAATAFAGTASAQTSVEIPLKGTLAKRCTISAFLNGPFDVLNLESTGVQGNESLTTNCNYGGSNFITLVSANKGKLVSGTNSVDYKFGLPSAGIALTSLATDQTFEYGKGAPANSNFTRSMQVQLDAIATVAGTYTDTVTISVATN